MLEYLLYHDLVEVYAGDAKFNNPAEMATKNDKEAASLKQILTILPNPKRYKRLIDEYESRQSREAQLAKAIDCLDACVRNLNDDKKTNKDGFTEDLIRDKYLPHVSKFQFTLELFEILMTKLKQQKKL